MSSGSETICGHTFDPERWQTDLPDVESNLDEEWVCTREVDSNENSCVFHMSTEERAKKGITDADVVDRLVAELSKEGTEPKQFIDATFGTVDLSHVEIDPPDNRPIDFRHATFEGKLLLNNSTVTNRVWFRGGEFKQVRLHDVHLQQDCDWYGCHFEKTVYADRPVFGGKALFARSRFEAGVRLRKSPRFDGKATFTGAFFDSYLEIKAGRFNDQAFFRDVDFGRASFRKSRFTESASFADATFNKSEASSTESADFSDTVFNGIVNFGSQDLDEDYDAATFNCEPQFSDATFNSLADFVGVELTGDVVFENLTSNGVFEFNPVLADTELVHIDLTGAKITAGTVDQPSEGYVLFDFHRAEVGELQITTETSDPSALNAVRFIKCEFNGFDFTSYRPALEPEFSIHEFTEVPDAPETELEPAERETTYQKAKAGADRVGDNRAASQFFIQEMRARKSRLAEQLEQSTKEVDRRRYQFRYDTNRIFDVVAIYGESATRVIWVSIAIVLIYASFYGIWYNTFGGRLDLDAPFLLNYALLSLESFTGLVHGGGARIDDWVIRLAAASEAFVGAFFIALFLFTLTRSVYR